MAKAAPNIASGRSFHNVSAGKWTDSQLALTFTQAGMGHNQPLEVIDSIERLKALLIQTHPDLLARFRDLELACGRIPDPITTEVDAAAAIDVIAQCRLQLRYAEAARKQEEALFLRVGRAADAFFKGRFEGLRVAVAPTVARLKAYYTQVAAVERINEQTREAAEDARQAPADGEAHRASRERLSQTAQTFAKPDALRHADPAEHAEAGRVAASGLLDPTRIRGNYGTTAFVRRSWTFQVDDLDQVPREYMSLDAPVIREAIAQEGIRQTLGLRIFQTEGLRVRKTASARSPKAQSQREQTVETSKSAEVAKHRSPPGQRKPKRRGRASSASDPQLVVPMKLIWGDQKVLRYYRQALASLQPHDAVEIAKFRAANAAIEARLWRKLPQRMEEIEFLYGGGPRVSPETGEGTAK